MTTDELVPVKLLNFYLSKVSEWRESDQFKQFLAMTGEGAFIYVWIAELVDGTYICQFDDKGMDMASFKDGIAFPPESSRRSTNTLPYDKIKAMYFMPTWLCVANSLSIKPVRVLVNLEDGDRIFAYWQVDHSAIRNDTIRRNVIGISKTVGGIIQNFYLVIGPHGSITICTNPNQNFVGW